MTVGFRIASAAEVDASHAAGGTAIEDPPGVRQAPPGRLYLAYLRDPDGDRPCAAYERDAA